LLILSLLFMGRALIPSPGYALGGLDMRGLFYPWWTAAGEGIRDGRLPLWDSSQFGGYPFLANPQVALFYPPTWLAILLPTRIGISLFVVLHLWVAGVGLLLLVRQMGGSRAGAGLAALTFAFGGFLAARIVAGHVGLIATDAWLPWLLLATAWSVRRSDLPSAVVAGAPLGLAILAGHTTSLVYVGIAWAAFAVFLFVTQASRGIVARQVGVALTAGLALAAVQILPFAEFSRASSRSAAPTFEFATAFSMPPAHLITLLIPEFFGEPIRAGYWSVPNFEELTYYAGTLPLLGLILALRRPTRLTWYYLAVMGFGLLVALGSYGFLYRLLYDWLPPFRLLRAPGRAAFLFAFGASALLGETVSAWERLDGAERERLRGFLRGVLIVCGLIVAAGLAATGAAFAAIHPAETSGRLWHQIGGWALAAIWLGIGGVLLWRYLGAEGGSRRALAGGLAALIVADLWTFGLKLVRVEATAPAALWTDAREIVGETDQRVLPWGVSIFEQNGAGQVGLRSVFGYNALEVAANQAFAASVPDPRSTAYDVLGVKYVVAGGPLDQYTQGERPLALVGETGSAWVYRRARVLDIARLVYAVEVIESADAATARVHAPDFDPATTTILSAPPPCEIGPAPETEGSAEVVEAGDGSWRIETRSESPTLLVLSETAYPGWRVAVDGQPAAPLTAYTVVRAVCVPAGTHTVEWSYQPAVYWIGGGISLAAFAGVTVAAFMSARDARREKEPIPFADSDSWPRESMIDA
jgi:hypothetical protein